MQASPATWQERVVCAVIDGGLLAVFMMVTGVVVSVIEAPGSPVHHAIASPVARRALIGLAIGLTAIALIYSPLGGRSGAHMNPAVTLSFLRLGKIRLADAAGYLAAQFIGGLLGVYVIGWIIGAAFTAPPISFAPTVPGPPGPLVAFIAEAAMTFVLMLIVLVTSNRKNLARCTGAFAGLLVGLYIVVEAPLSGMSLNPARSLGSAVPSTIYTALWLYFVAPIAGMLLAAEFYTAVGKWPAVHCCKLDHTHQSHCIHCGCDGPIDFDAHPESNASVS